MNHSHLGTTAASAENLSFRPPESRQQLEEKDENEMKGLAVGCMLALAAMSGALAEDQRNVNLCKISVLKLHCSRANDTTSYSAE